MTTLLILSHADLSETLYKTVSLIMGRPKDNVHYITLPYGKNLEQYQSEIEKVIEDSGSKGTLILTDLMGGSPFMITARVYSRLKNEYPLEMITGVNMPMVMEVISNLEGHSLEELKKIALESGKSGIVDFKEAIERGEPEREGER